MELLTRTEEIVLTAVLQLRDEAYGVTIRHHIEQTIGKPQGYIKPDAGIGWNY